MAKHAFAIALLASTAVGSTAYAQDMSVPAAKADESLPEPGEIIVRAQRVEQRLQDVPVAVTPVTAQELENKRLSDLPQLALAVPSLTVATDNSFNLRGIGSQIFTPNVDSSVGVAVDDVSLGVPIFMSNAAFVDMEQVEVLTGPQGLLFGRNASAGLLNLVTKRPEIGRFGGSVNLEYQNRKAPGTSDGYTVTGVLNIPTGSNSALRLNVLQLDQDPVGRLITNLNPDNNPKQRRLMGKAKWLYENDGFSFYVIGDYSRERGIGGIWDDSWRVVGIGASGVPNSGSIGQGFVTFDNLTPGPENLLRAANSVSKRDVDTYGISTNVGIELSDQLTLSNILAWRAYDLDFNLESDLSSAPAIDRNGGTSAYNQYSNELRLAFEGQRIDGQVGLYYFKSDLANSQDFTGTAGFPFVLIDSASSSALSSRSLAAYGLVNFHATDALTLIAGARVTNDKVSIDADIANNAIVAIFGPTQSYAQSNTHTNFSYKVGAQYDINDDVMTYATWTTGYKGPAQQTALPAVGVDPYLEPETVGSLEAGVKGLFFDRALRLNITAFYSRFKNFQVSAFDANGLSLLTNADKVETKGIEVNSTLRLGRGFAINYNATLLDSKFKNFPGNACFTNQNVTVGFVGTCPNNSFFNGAGIRTPVSPTYNGTVELVYGTELGSGKLDVSVNWNHRSSVNFSAAANPYTRLGPIDLFGANIAYRLDNGISLSVFCKNCTNEVNPVQLGAFPIDAATGANSIFQRWGYNSVRTFGASVRFDF